MTKLIHIRRFIQISILLILILSPISQIVRTYRQDPYPYMESPLVRKANTENYLDENDLSIKKIIEPVYDDINGGPYSLDFYIFNFEEPFTGTIYSFRNLFLSEYWNWVSIMAVGLPLLFAFFFGRIYCGYVCPWSLIVSWNLKIQKKLFNRVPNTTASIHKGIRKWKSIYFIALTSIVLLNPMVLQYILPPAILQHSASDYILFGSYTLWGIALLVFLSFEVLQPAMICRNLCPTGLFLTLVGKLKIFSLGFDRKQKCLKGCDLCNEVCWLGLEPKTRAVDAACDMCARCMHVCPTDRLVIQKRKSKPVKLAKALIILCALSLFSCDSNKKEYEYYDYLSDVFLYENSVEQINQGDTLQILYAFVANKVTQQDGGIITFNVHIYKNGETFESPMNITVFRNNSLILDTILNESNYPISIGKRSVYRVPFELERNQKYHFTINSTDQSFEEINVDFSYPDLRF